MRSPEVVLKDAAALIERSGWCQGFSINTEGAHCILGAVLDVTGCAVEKWHWPITDDEASHALRLMITRVGGSVTSWNDATKRTKAEVLAMLRDEVPR